MLEEKLNFANSNIVYYMKTGLIGKLKLSYLQKGTYSLYFDLTGKKAGISNQVKPAHHC